MSTRLEIVRSAERRGALVKLDILVDGESVGALGRGQRLVRDVPAGEHTVQAVWRDDRKSPEQRLTLTDGGQETRYVSFISERAAYLRSPTKPTDWVLLTEQASATPEGSWETRIRVALTFAMVVALVVNAFAREGSVLKLVTYVLFLVGALAVGVLLLRHYRRRYRAPERKSSGARR